MNQFLLNADGTFPAGANIEVLKAAGVVFVIPTEIPRESGMRAVELPAQQDADGVWRQQWALEPEPVPEAQQDGENAS